MKEKEDPSLARKVVIAAFLIACVALAIYVVIWAQKPSYCLLPSKLDSLDKEMVLNVLEDNSLPFRLERESGELFIKLNSLADLNKALNKEKYQKVVTSEIDFQVLPGLCLSSMASADTNIENGFPEPHIKPYQLRLIKLGAGAFFVILIVFLIIRPLLRVLVGNIDEQEQDIQEVLKIGDIILTPIWVKLLGSVFWVCLYLVGLAILFFPYYLGRYDALTNAFFIFCGSASFYQSINGLMSVQYYFSKITILENGIKITRDGLHTNLKWNQLGEVKVVEMSSVVHLYDKNGERVYSASTNLTSTANLLKLIDKKTNIEVDL